MPSLWSAVNRGKVSIAPLVRGGPKIGRIEVCPCGSGKKYKKWCGANDAPTTLH